MATVRTEPRKGSSSVVPGVKSGLRFKITEGVGWGTSPNRRNGREGKRAEEICDESVWYLVSPPPPPPV